MFALLLYFVASDYLFTGQRACQTAMSYVAYTLLRTRENVFSEDLLKILNYKFPCPWVLF